MCGVDAGIIFVWWSLLLHTGGTLANFSDANENRDTAGDERITYAIYLELELKIRIRIRN